MIGSTFRYGFRVVGNTAARRRLVDAVAALTGYAICDARAEVDREGYLSAFQFGEDFRELMRSSGSPKGFDGPCWSAFIWFDVDRPGDDEKSLHDTRRLASSILDRYKILNEDDLLIFFSGNKGYHLGLPTFWNPEPSVLFNQVARRFAETLAVGAGVVIDLSVYDKVRCFRAPNSRHPKTGLHKLRLSLDEVMHLSPVAVHRLASEPALFALPATTRSDERAVHDWAECEHLVREDSVAQVRRRVAIADGRPQLNRQTMDFIRDGAEVGDRHRLLFSAAANLAEFGCPPALAHALLTEAALDSGLSPKETQRQIECGLAHPKSRREGLAGE